MRVLPVNDSKHDRYVEAENFVRDALRCMGQHEDADNPKLVGRVVSKILRALPQPKQEG